MKKVLSVLLVCTMLFSMSIFSTNYYAENAKGLLEVGEGLSKNITLTEKDKGGEAALIIDNTGYYKIKVASSGEKTENYIGFALYDDLENIYLYPVLQLNSIEYKNIYLTAGTYYLYMAALDNDGNYVDQVVSIELEECNYSPIELTLDKTQEFSYNQTENAQFSFTPEESGDYALSYGDVLENDIISTSVTKDGSALEYRNSYAECVIFRLEAGETYLFNTYVAYSLDYDETNEANITISKLASNIYRPYIVTHDPILIPDSNGTISNLDLEIKIAYEDESVEYYHTSENRLDIFGFGIEYNGKFSDFGFATGWQKVKIHYFDTTCNCRVYITPMTVFGLNYGYTIDLNREYAIGENHDWFGQFSTFTTSKTGYYTLNTFFGHTLDEYIDFETLCILDNKDNFVKPNESGQYFLQGGKNYSIYMAGVFKETTTENIPFSITLVDEYKAVSFPDVAESDYFYSAVTWAYEKNIVRGDDYGLCNPEDICTRAEILTMLYRFAGEPEIESDYNPFVDVSEDDYFYKAVLWAVEKGITKGTSENTFSPYDTCTRANAITMIHRYYGSPRNYSLVSNGFEDVYEAQYFYNSAIWAFDNFITLGTDNTHFSPDDGCTRAQIITFIYRTV